MAKLKLFSSKASKRDSNATATTTTTEPTAASTNCGNPLYAQLEHLHRKAPVWRSRPSAKVALLERGEVHTSSSGKGLPIGYFYHTFEVARICLKERHGGSSTSDDASGPFSVVDTMMEDSEKDQDTDKDKSQQNGARQVLATSTMDRDGGSYYCIKFIPKKLYKKMHYEDEHGRFQQAVANLLVEAHYLSKFDHPHILKLQGQADTSFILDDHKQKQHDAFFLITDRISETLEDRLEAWRAEHAKDPTSHPVDPTCPLFLKKLGYVRDIASALQYLHERKIMVLGLNPNGIGFLAQSGRLQLCDLGTCREVAALNVGRDSREKDLLSPPEGDEGMSFQDDEIGDGERFSKIGNATGAGSSGSNDRDVSCIVPFVETGTIPRYLAPEVVTRGAAGASLLADSYSISIIAVETLTLQKAYTSFKSGQFLVKVCMEGKRPNLSMYPQLPPPIEGILRRSWRHSAEKRWSCAEIYEGYQLIVEKLEGNDSSKLPSSDTAKQLSSRMLMLPDATKGIKNSKSFEDESIMGQSVRTSGSNPDFAKSTFSHARDRTSKLQRRENRGSAAKGSTQNGRGFWKSKSVSDLFAAVGVSRRVHSDDQGVITTEPEEASSPVISHIDEDAKVADLPATDTSPSPIRSSNRGDDESDAKVQEKESDAHLHEEQTASEIEPANEPQTSTNSEKLPTPSDESNEGAIVLGDGTTIAIKKDPSRRNIKTAKKTSKGDSETQKSNKIKRIHSGPSVPSTSTDKSLGNVKSRSRRTLSVDESVLEKEQSEAPLKQAPTADEVRTKKLPQRKRSGPKKELRSIAENDNTPVDAPTTSGTKKLPRRKNSSDRTKPLTEPNNNDVPAVESEAADVTEHNNARHRRSFEVHETPILASPLVPSAGAL